MGQLFEDMMQRLKEVEAYLDGARVGYRVHVPEDVDVIAKESEAVMRALGREKKLPGKRAQSKAA